MGWLIAGILALILFRMRHSFVAPFYRKLADLFVLQLELKRLRAAGGIEHTAYEQTRADIDAVGAEILQSLGVTPEGAQWQEKREAAWWLLHGEHARAANPPPWRSTRRETPQEDEPERQQQPPMPPGATTPQEMSPAVPLSLSSSASVPTVAESYAWQPTQPNTLERALQALSDWSTLLLPFLVQNIGWFIGGLCLVAGSIFLVSYTRGFAKALTVFGILFAYTVSILWTGYQLRRRRPELSLSSNVVLTVGVLLVPLNLAAAVRLLQALPSFSWLSVVSVVTIIGSLAGLYMVVTLASGIMDRALQHRHPQLFLALAALQLLAPLLARASHWSMLALVHLMLLGLLACGLRLFVNDWLRSLFVEQRKIAYYAAGTLVYAAAVSFFHLTWSYTGALPGGYASPFLILLCGVLFFVDARLQQWTKQDVLLTRLSFALYGLSILAVLLCLHAPAARLLTLVLATGLYSLVVWQYLTAPPLYLLLGCLVWLYSLLILQYLPNQWHLLASLPGLFGLFAASRWLQQHQAPILALVCYRTWLGLLFALTAWSLFSAQPGLVAMSTALATMGCLFYGFPSGPAQLLDNSNEQGTVDLRNSPWLYSITLMGSIAVAYAPRWMGMTWATQCTFGLVLLAAVWSTLGIQRYHTVSQETVPTVEGLLNSALLNLCACVPLVVALLMPGLTYNRTVPLALAAMGGVLLQLSLTFRVREVFYGVLALWGTAAALVKLTYFPALSAGIPEMVFAFAMWTLVWWLEREPAEILALRREQANLLVAQRPSIMLFWRLPTFVSQIRQDVLCTPLQQAMVLLWALGLGHLGLRLLAGELGWGWAFSASLGAMNTLLGAGYFRVPALLPFAFVLGLGAWDTVVFQLGGSAITTLSFASILYALLVWRLGLVALAHAPTARLAKFLHVGGDRIVIEEYLHSTAAVIVGCSAVTSLVDTGVLTPSLPALLLLAGSTIVASIVGWRYQHRSWSLAALVMLVVLLHEWPFLWVPPVEATLLLPWSALQLVVLSWILLWCGELSGQAAAQAESGELAFSRTAQRKSLGRLWSDAWPAITLLAGLEWIVHFLRLLDSLTTQGHPQWLMGYGDAVAALLTAGALLALGIQQARRSQQDEWIYGVALFGGAVGVYIRLLIVGVAPVTVWDTAALMLTAYALFVLQRLTRSEPLLHVVMVLPLLTLFTVPLQLASLHASGTLMTAGVLYMLAHHETDRPAPLYLAMLALNAAVYLWVPGWAERAHLFQVYTIPAAVSVLLLLHLHRHELPPSVLNHTRLAATSVLYASVMVDVFLRDELQIFVLALFLSLVGIVLGIALRTRAFLYSGVTFFVLNVVGQLLLLFPEQRLGKAIVLLVLGVAITGGMIWVNAQREQLLRRIRIFRSDLATWE